MQLTPLFEQYRQIKSRYPDTLLLFRVGDFYEFYYEDAKRASAFLGITLTGKTINQNTRVPLAGVPVKASEHYIAKLVKNGFKVAICEQLEPPDKSKKLIARDVIEVITPGTILRPALLDEAKGLTLACCIPDENATGVAFCDITSGDFSCGEIATGQLPEILARREVRELVVPEGVKIQVDVPLTTIDGYHFIHEIASQKLLDHFGVVTLDGFGVGHTRLGISAAGALLHYLSETQKSSLPQVNALHLFEAQGRLYLDSATRRNLEIFENVHREETKTLLWAMDSCLTPFGKRLLRAELLEPMLDPTAIRTRQDAVEELKNKEFLRQQLRVLLKPLRDVERITARLLCQRVTAREMVALKESLAAYPEIKALVAPCSSEVLCRVGQTMRDFTAVTKAVQEAIADDPPAALDEPGTIREGFSKELDELRDLARGGKQWVAELQERERSATGIPSLKIGYNSVFGYYIEVTKPNLGLVPASYIRKQTLANAERFYTTELKEFEEKITSAEAQMIGLEASLFAAVREQAAQHGNEIMEATRQVALLDLIAAFAENAAVHGYVRPVLAEDDRISIVAGRHPVVERILETGSFIPNDATIDRARNQIIIITGPNMAGKSTYLRQVALLCIMAQTGSYIPAQEASIGVVDKIFTRIGASDDISRGVSTFLAEMSETANILNNVSERSLVILDEVGRGTSTYDGLALAWAVVEELHASKRPRTLFATHFHELTRIEDFLTGVKNYNFLVKEWGDEIIFLRKIAPGPTDQSYGIQVARLAGIPQSVIARAKQVLRDFEEGEVFSIRKLKKAKLSQQDLFVDQT